MTHAYDLNPKPYLRPHDVGTGILVTIQRWEIKSFYDHKTRGDVQKGVLHFAENRKYLIVNQTQIDQIIKSLGTPDLESWIGQKIVLFTKSVKVGNEYKDAIRARAPKQTKRNV